MMYETKSEKQQQQKDSVLLFYAIATVFQLYLDSDMMYEIRWRKLKPTLLQLKGSITFHTMKAWYERNWPLNGEMDCSTAKCYDSDRIHSCAQGHLPRALTN